MSVDNNEEKITFYRIIVKVIIYSDFVNARIKFVYDRIDKRGEHYPELPDLVDNVDPPSRWPHWQCLLQHSKRKHGEMSRSFELC